MDSRAREILARMFIDPLLLLMERQDEPDAEAMTYVFADLFSGAVGGFRRMRASRGDMLEIVSVADAYADRYAGFLNCLECKMAVRSLLKGKTIFSVFPVEGYHGEPLRENAS